MRLLPTLLVLGACVGAPSPSEPVADRVAEPALPPLGQPDPRPHIDAPTKIADFLPTTLDGQAPGALSGPYDRTFQISAREVRVSIDPIDDLAATRGSFELLGKDVNARMGDQELRGLRVQGNPAQLARDLDAPHGAVLTVVAANTFLVTVRVTPSEGLDEPLHFAEQIDIGGLTRLALLQTP